MENLESNLVEKNQKANLKNNRSFSPKVISILLIVNLVIGVFTLIGVGYLSYKNNSRTEMMRGFRNGGGFQQNGGGGYFNQQPPASGSSN
ncbi:MULTISPECIES: hypothetical protein [unclassified Bacillus (in: firmicutes)]|uniref:hypothetical protein n=1 Tax=Bacillaceae TaxID=186817 RepID=UPI000BEF55A3|nr:MULTISPECIES: hypothetical protein [unclassified Bacillus (in: firmicutes)]PEJ56765.1 hypothetical protein CN692_16145 [Bacillus sp. AFS002410]PEK98524.1 hypothetical protein CN601_25420 [Bacillus sp. AFS017336]QKE73821.1 hypothetical protein HPK19_13830 [Arthrobacter citreus]